MKCFICLKDSPSKLEGLELLYCKSFCNLFNLYEPKYLSKLESVEFCRVCYLDLEELEPTIMTLNNIKLKFENNLLFNHIPLDQISNENTKERPTDFETRYEISKELRYRRSLEQKRKSREEEIFKKSAQLKKLAAKTQQKRLIILSPSKKTRPTRLSRVKITPLSKSTNKKRNKTYTEKELKAKCMQQSFVMVKKLKDKQIQNLKKILKCKRGTHSKNPNKTAKPTAESNEDIEMVEIDELPISPVNDFDEDVEMVMPKIEGATSLNNQNTSKTPCVLVDGVLVELIEVQNSEISASNVNVSLSADPIDGQPPSPTQKMKRFVRTKSLSKIIEQNQQLENVGNDEFPIISVNEINENQNVEIASPNESHEVIELNENDQNSSNVANTKKLCMFIDGELVELIEVQDSEIIKVSNVDPVINENPPDGQSPSKSPRPKRKRVKRIKTSSPKKRVTKPAIKNAETPQCNVCGRIFKNMQNLTFHMELHDPNRSRHVCDKCGKSYCKLAVLKTHIKNNHSNIPESSYVTCDECEKRMPQWRLKEHKRFHMRFKMFACKICNKGFNGQKELSDHHLNHTLPKGEKPFKCDLCPATFTVEGNLQYHKKRRHFEKEKYVFKCDECDSTFKRKDARQAHVLRYHKPVTDRRFLCDWEGCGKGFINKNVYTYHMNKHNNIRPYICDHCGIAFFSKMVLTDHIKKFHENDNPSNCNICGKEFLSKRKLTNHLYTHKRAKGKITTLKEKGREKKVKTKSKNIRESSSDSSQDEDYHEEKSNIIVEEVTNFDFNKMF